VNLWRQAATDANAKPVLSMAEMAALVAAGPPSLQEGESVEKPVLPGDN
jgi:hypothetical protein